MKVRINENSLKKMIKESILNEIFYLSQHGDYDSPDEPDYNTWSGTEDISFNVIPLYCNPEFIGLDRDDETMDYENIYDEPEYSIVIPVDGEWDDNDANGNSDYESFYPYIDTIEGILPEIMKQVPKTNKQGWPICELDVSLDYNEDYDFGDEFDNAYKEKTFIFKKHPKMSRWGEFIGDIQ